MTFSPRTPRVLRNEYIPPGRSLFLGVFPCWRQQRSFAPRSFRFFFFGEMPRFPPPPFGWRWRRRRWFVLFDAAEDAASGPFLRKGRRRTVVVGFQVDFRFHYRLIYVIRLRNLNHKRNRVRTLNHWTHYHHYNKQNKKTHSRTANRGLSVAYLFSYRPPRRTKQIKIKTKEIK